MKNLTKALSTSTGHGLFKMQLGFFVALLLLINACTDSMLKDEDISNDLSLLSQSLSKEFGKLGISDAANGGRVDEFYFLAPTVGKAPKYYKDFNPNLKPIVEISDDLGFKNYHAVFNRDGAADGKVVVNNAEESYFVDWAPSQTKALVGKIYRIRVRVGEKVLGHLDVGVVPSKQTKALQDGLIPVVQNENFRIAFRLEDKECPARIEVKPSEATVVVGGEQQYEAIVYNFYGEVLTDLAFLNIKWSVGDGDIASVDDDGLATGKKFGFTEVKAKSFDVEGQALIFVQEAGGDAPRPGKDVVVLNDVNPFFDQGIANPNNVQFIKNLINFDAPEIRGAGTKIWFDCGRNTAHALDTPIPCGSSNRYNPFRNLIASQGFTLEDISSAMGTLVNIPKDVKVIFLWLPRVAYTVAEINALKSFANEGGRIVFIGEWDGFYGATGLAVENQFLINMGAVMRNIGQAVDCGYNTLPAASLRPHPITRDMTNLTIACASVIQLGPNDFPLFYDQSNTRVLGGVAQIDTNPITELKNARIDPSEQVGARIQGGLNPIKSSGY